MDQDCIADLKSLGCSLLVTTFTQLCTLRTGS